MTAAPSGATPERGRRIDGDDSGTFGSGDLVPSPAYLTLEEVITRYRGKVSEGTLRNWRTMRIGPSFIKIGKAVLYPVANSIVGTNPI